MSAQQLSTELPDTTAMVPPHIQACADSGTTDTLFKMSDSIIATNIQPSTGFRVRVANNSIITSTHTGYIKIPHIPGEFLKVHIFDDNDLGKTLLSISDMCNTHNCTAVFKREGLVIMHGDSVIYEGTKGPDEKLWTLDMCKQPPDHNFQPPAESAARANWSVKLNLDSEVVSQLVARCFRISSSVRILTTA